MIISKLWHWATLNHRRGDSCSSPMISVLLISSWRSWQQYGLSFVAEKRLKFPCHLLEQRESKLKKPLGKGIENHIIDKKTTIEGRIADWRFGIVCWCIQGGFCSALAYPCSFMSWGKKKGKKKADLFAWSPVFVWADPFTIMGKWCFPLLCSLM